MINVDMENKITCFLFLPFLLFLPPPCSCQNVAMTKTKIFVFCSPTLTIAYLLRLVSLPMSILGATSMTVCPCCAQAQVQAPSARCPHPCHSICGVDPSNIDIGKSMC